MIGRNTLYLYFARKFLLSFVGAISLCVALIFLVETVENLRRASSHDTGIGVVFLLTLFRMPALIEQVLPFATLFAAIASFLMLSRSLELVVVRAIGMSVWGFIAPAMILTLILGIFATTVFNPVAANLKARYETMFAQNFTAEGLQGFGASFGRQLWLRQDGVDGPSVLYARVSDNGGQTLHGVTAFVYDHEGRFVERVEAPEATIGNNIWRLNDATVIEPGRPEQRYPSYLISTFLSREQVQESFASADSVPFWDLPEHQEIAVRAGLSDLPYRLQYQVLLARPLLLCAMVLIGATVSLRVFRFGNVGQMILGGVIAGFVLYVVTKLAADLATAGAISPAAAAWAPPLIATLWGTTLLLFQEDG